MRTQWKIFGTTFQCIIVLQSREKVLNSITFFWTPDLRVQINFLPVLTHFLHMFCVFFSHFSAHIFHNSNFDCAKNLHLSCLPALHCGVHFAVYCAVPCTVYCPAMYTPLFNTVSKRHVRSSSQR